MPFSSLLPSANAGMTCSAKSRSRRNLSSKWMLIQNWRAPASIVRSSFFTQSAGVPTMANRSAR